MPPFVIYKPRMGGQSQRVSQRRVPLVTTVTEILGALKATSHSTIFDIPMRPLREDQKHRDRFTC